MASTTSNESNYLLTINHVRCLVHVLLAFYFGRLAQRKAHSRRPKGSTYFATSTPFPREEWPRMRKDTFYAHLFSIEICHAFEIARLARCFQVDVPYEQLCTSLFAIFNNSLKIYMYELLTLIQSSLCKIAQYISTDVLPMYFPIKLPIWCCHFYTYIKNINEIKII